MALTTLSSRKGAVTSSIAARKAVPAPIPRKVFTRAVGDVQAPIEYAIGAAVIVSLVATAIIPIALKPGQEAADKIFDSRQKAPLDKAASSPKKTGKK